MRRKLRGFKISVVRDVLKELGYRGGAYHVGFPSAYDDWVKGDLRRGGFQVKLTESLDGVTLYLHRDPPFHIGAKHYKGKDLEDEVKKIIQSYRTLLRT